jgi:hypothetical protein
MNESENLEMLDVILIDAVLMIVYHLYLLVKIVSVLVDVLVFVD